MNQSGGTAGARTRCTAANRDQERCRAFARPGRPYCKTHDPEQASEVAAARSRGATTANKLRAIEGRRAKLATPAELVAFTAGAIHDTVDGKLPVDVARTVFYGISIQRQLIEASDLAARVEALRCLEGPEDRMTTLKGVTRHYDQLSPEERFRLSMLAVARGDEAENDRLIRTCPKQTFRVNDPAFSGRCSAAYHLVEALMGQFTYWAGWLDAFDALADPLGSAILALVGEPANGDDQGHVHKFAPRSLAVGRRLALAQMKANWEAFAAVCENVAGVAPEVLIAAWFPPFGETLSARKEDWAEIDADPAEVGELREKLGQVWQKALTEIAA